jgi:hypothetical protein
LPSSSSSICSATPPISGRRASDGRLYLLACARSATV